MCSLPAMPRVFVPRKPPRMCRGHEAGIWAKRELCSLSPPSSGRFNDDPIALFDAFLSGRIRMNLNDRVSMKLSEPWHLSVFRVEDPGLTRARNQDIGIFLEEFRCAHRTFRGLPVLRERIIPHLFEDGGVKLKLPCGSGEPSLFILVILYLSPDVIHLLKVIPGDVHRMEDMIKGLLKIVPPVLALANPVSKVVEHFMVRAAFADLNDLAPGQDIAMTFPEVADVIHLKPRRCRQHDGGQLG